jgi:two-component system response regulator HydG
MDLLLGYNWPGNVRELENAIERALVIGRGPDLEPSDFSFQLQEASALGEHTLEEMERVHIERVYHECDGNHSRAARVLGIDRTTLYNKIRKYGLK